MDNPKRRDRTKPEEGVFCRDYHSNSMSGDFWAHFWGFSVSVFGVAST